MQEPEIRKKLHSAGLRITYPRLVLIGELARSNAQPKSAAELSATLSQFPRSSIYRNLDALEKAGLIKSSLIKWVRRYEPGDALTPHHHHIVCEKCQTMVDFDSQRLEKRLELIAQNAGYTLSSHVVELRGLCADCADKPERKTARDVLSLGISSMKRLRSIDPLMEKLKEEDHYAPFPHETEANRGERAVPDENGPLDTP